VATVGGETENSVSGWTVDTLAQHYRQRFDDLTKLLDERALGQQTAMSAALASADRATAKAEVAANSRFESVNEFRAQLNDQASTFMTRAEANALLAAVGERLTRIEERLNVGAGQDSGQAEARELRQASARQALLIIGSVVATVSVAVALILGLNT
jgi:hypothetical protein